jgi:xylulokinase
MGIDLGTSGCKGVVLDGAGVMVASARRQYAIRSSRPGWATLDPNAVWRVVADLISQLAHRARRAGTIVRGVAFAVSGDEAIPIDPAGRVLYPCIMAPDDRSRAEGAALFGSVGALRLHETTGLPPAAIHPLVRLMWLRNHRPRIYRRLARYMSWEEFIAHRLGMEAVASPSIAARTMGFDIRRKSWSDELLHVAGVSRDVFPTVVDSGVSLGHVPSHVATSLGLLGGTSYVVGGLDQSVAALGAGCTDPGMAMVGTGSWEALTVITDEAPRSSSLVRGGYSIGPYVTPDRFAVMATSSSGGALVAWAANLVAPGTSIARLLAQLPARATGLLALPHLGGSYSPWLDADSRGAIVGLSFDTGARTIIRAVLEGITYELRESVGRLSNAGVAIRHLRCTGGGARSSAWLQLKADVLGRAVERLNHVDTGAVGAACLAGAGSGVFSTVEGAVRNAVRVVEVFEPGEPNQRDYAAMFSRYRALYEALRRLRTP